MMDELGFNIRKGKVWNAIVIKNDNQAKKGKKCVRGALRGVNLTTWELGQKKRKNQKMAARRAAIKMKEKKLRTITFCYLFKE